jgi:hypothetical protein
LNSFGWSLKQSFFFSKYFQNLAVIINPGAILVIKKVHFLLSACTLAIQLSALTRGSIHDCFGDSTENATPPISTIIKIGKNSPP